LQWIAPCASANDPRKKHMESYNEVSVWEERLKLEKAKKVLAIVKDIRVDRVTDKMVGVA